jgi:hypothetical protein
MISKVLPLFLKLSGIRMLAFTVPFVSVAVGCGAGAGCGGGSGVVVGAGLPSSELPLAQATKENNSIAENSTVIKLVTRLIDFMSSPFSGCLPM